MHHRGGGLEREANDFVGCRAVEVRDEANPARVVLFDDEGRIGVIAIGRGDVRDGGGTSLQRPEKGSQAESRAQTLIQ
jgi:hypothetical protein